ncbi:hypothetical protein [Mongoliitalea daihaiensis]|uniref:hypothetical protein n=1 Tax=Mongoliitalea daihaiensis TaxID=2782006 RepID=UPI001F461460|nr:hypothetical protein [Mongoliitalea daihaiensis]UJP64023.1 hypothetical protein IPZ59_14510 [Mongoliitalea daihaiensis]
MQTTANKSELDAARAEKISKSKIYGDGVTPVVGIMDILFYNNETGETKKYDGQTEDGRIIILLPFRTARYLNKWASYSIPSSWKLKHSVGDYVNAVIEDGYINKLMEAKKFLKVASIITEAVAETAGTNVDATENATAPVEHPSMAAPESKAEVTASEQVPAGFEDSEDSPF